MASKTLFSTGTGPLATTVNEAGGIAYARTDEQTLAVYALTGCLSGTFYATDKDQLTRVLDLSQKVSPEFLAKLAVYARENGRMKDMPALLTAILAKRDIRLCAAIFPKVIDNGKMLRNFVQMVRSGAIGRKSLGTRPKKLIWDWLKTRSPEALFRQSTGQSPSLKDIVKLVHPKPVTDEARAFYGWLVEKPYEAAHLPVAIQAFEAFKKGEGEIPDVPFEMLTALPLTDAQWKSLALRMTWTQTRMNLNTMARHKVFEDTEAILKVAAKLEDPAEVLRSRCFPYQLLMAYKAAKDVPMPIRLALQKAMEVATGNVPEFGGRVVVAPDVSGSMRSSVTGYRAGATSDVQCVDVAALVASTVLRRNPNARVLPFECGVVPLELNPLDSIMTNAEKLAKVGGGGTDCSAPLAKIHQENALVDLFIYVSDNESWADRWMSGGRTGTMTAWAALKKRCPNAKMVCIDIQPTATSQVVARDDILCVAGWSDQVWDVIRDFATGSTKQLTDAVRAVNVDLAAGATACREVTSQ